MTTFLSTPIDPDAVGAPFYLDVLRENGVAMEAITVDNFFYRDDELDGMCLDIIESAFVDTYLERSKELLTRYPTNALVLRSIAQAGATDEASLGAALALRELSNVLLTQERDVPLDAKTQLKICCVGAEVLFQYLLWLDLSGKVMPILLEKVQRVPESRDYLLMTLFRTAAVCDIRHEEDEGGSFYSEMRSIFAEVHADDPSLMWDLHLADTVRTFIFDGPDAEGLDSMIANLTALPLTKDQQFSIDRYLDVEPILKELFDRSDPAKDLHRLIARQNLTSIEEISDFVKQFTDKPIPKIPYEELTEDERVEDAMDAILHHQSADMPQQLLALATAHPTSLWPWVGLARIADDAADVLSYADRGLALAKEASVDPRTEAYLELLDERAGALLQESRFAEAIDCYEQLISIDDAYLTQNGEALLAALLRRGQRQHLERAEQIINALRSNDDGYLPALPWLTLLHRLITKRDESVINVALADAMSTLPHVRTYHHRIARRTNRIYLPTGDESDEEATLHTLYLARICWPVYPDAVKKLKKVLTHPPGPLSPS